MSVKEGGAGKVFASTQQLLGCLVIFPDLKIRGYNITMFDCIAYFYHPYMYCEVDLNFFYLKGYYTIMMVSLSSNQDKMRGSYEYWGNNKISIT